MRWKIVMGAGLLSLAGLAAGVVVSGAGMGRAAGILPWQDAAAVARGAEVYAEYCAACHGAELEGEADWRTAKPDGKMPAPPQDETGHTWHHADTQLFLITKYGIEAMVGGGYRSDMQGFDGVLDDQQILDVLAYIKSRWPAEVVRAHERINAAAADN